jgi:hypothetical protein
MGLPEGGSTHIPGVNEPYEPQVNGLTSSTAQVWKQAVGVFDLAAKVVS